MVVHLFNLQLSIFSAHQNVEDSDSDDDDCADGSGEERESDEETDDEEVPELVQRVKETTLYSQIDGSDEDAEDDKAQDSFSVENEIIKQRVQRDRQARQNTGAKRRSRNSSKLSIKGKLYHKNDW